MSLIKRNLIDFLLYLTLVLVHFINVLFGFKINVDFIIAFEFRLIQKNLIETIDDNICSKIFY